MHLRGRFSLFHLIQGVSGSITSSSISLWTSLSVGRVAETVGTVGVVAEGTGAVGVGAADIGLVGEDVFGVGSVVAGVVEQSIAGGRGVVGDSKWLMLRFSEC
jgi:hypothetical protein